MVVGAVQAQSRGATVDAQLPSADERFTLLGAPLLVAAQYAQNHGANVDALLGEEGLSLAALADPKARVPQGVFNRLFQHFAGADDAFGLHLAEHTPLDGFSIVGHLASRSATLGEALTRIARFSRIVHDAGRVEVETLDEEVHVHPGCRGLTHHVPRHVAEHAVASVLIQARAILGRPLPVLRVEFRHGRPASTNEHQRVLGVDALFGRAENCVVIPVHALAWQLPGSDPGLTSLLERYASDLLSQLAAEGDLVAHLEAFIMRSLVDGVPSLKDAARHLGLGPRTLQRRLAGLEARWDQLVDGVQRNLAQRCVANRELSLQEVAFLVGFADPSNFFRAFRRWFGVGPTEWRARGD